ncbi:hypothetical protein DH2020_035569 [Rehmannia glutinosa]|uniref:Methyltransferase type 11 domain-containing protein n=1 Tax=Rehmannia glutinosa TaxID=99300 RepID=A0ABR0V6D9_REHGL
MATVGPVNNNLSVSAGLLLSRLSLNPMRRCFCVVKTSRLIPAIIHGRLFTDKIRASSAAVVETKPDVMDETKLDIRKKILACPICYERLIWNGDHDVSLESVARSTLQCCTCKKSYSGKDSHLDLTITGGGTVYGQPMAASTELFRLPLVSFLYERGWRQSFSVWGGFPGPEKEASDIKQYHGSTCFLDNFELIKDYLKPVLGGNIIDASCGSGMFSRLFAKSGLFSLVVALDFSETMLQQCHDFIKLEDSFPKSMFLLQESFRDFLPWNLILVRADISRLPFTTSTVDAVHAGAALHCWPSPSAAVAEISRVLKPGGMFVATTYIVDGLLSYFPLRKPLRQAVMYFYPRENSKICVHLAGLSTSNAPEVEAL